MAKTSLEETADQVVLHSDQEKERARFSSLCQAYLGMDDDKLCKAGHRSLGDALVHAVKEHKNKLNKLMNAYIAKWPD